ncbi:MFS transporter [Dyella sp.]|uniref:MFS transporter n=1 Tax=Dyella sp. TaxID=1869338 RepID=UPI002ED3955D
MTPLKEAGANHAPMPAWITWLLATACGLIVANIYYAQPLAGPISTSLGMSPQMAGTIVTMTQVGYGLGLLFLVPLGDLFENRRLVFCALALDIVALVAAGVAFSPVMFLVAALFIGFGSVAVQVLVPYAAHLSPEATRGRAVGNVMSGLMLGIMLARPVASLVTQLSSWHVIFIASAAIMVLLGVVLWRALPQRMPSPRPRYRELLASMGHLALTTPILRRRALYQACLFAAFSIFWTVTPLWLASPAFGLSQGGIAIFALLGVAGAIAAPLAGRMADRGWTRAATLIAMLAVGIAFALTRIDASLVLLVLAAFVIDFGVSANLVLGQRAIFALNPAHRSRLNGLFMATFFLGGAAGSGLGGWAYAHGGWPLASWLGIGLTGAALLYFATEPRRRPL